MPSPRTIHSLQYRDQRVETLVHPHNSWNASKPLKNALLELLQSNNLPDTSAEWNAWFRKVSCPRNRSEYSRSYRYQLANSLNALLDFWHTQGWISERCQVQNYRRGRPTNVLDVPVLLELSPTALELLTRAFIVELANVSMMNSPEKRWERAFWHFAFAFIRFGGGAWASVFSDMARWQWRHLRTAGDGYLLIPRDGVELRIYVPPIVQLCALVLGAALPRPSSQKSPDDNQLILPSSGKTDSSRNVQMQRRRFQHWLDTLATKARMNQIRGVDERVSIQTLAQASVHSLLQMYSPLIVGTMIGKVGYSPVPDAQRNVFASYLPGKSEPSARQNKLAPQELVTLWSPSTQDTDDSSEAQIEGWIRKLHHTCRPLFGKAAHRKVASENLFDLARTILSHFEITVSSHPIRLIGQTEKVVPSMFNLAVTALFIAVQCTTRATPSTLAAKRSDLVDLVRGLEDIRFDMVDEEDVREVLAMDRAVASRRRLASTWKELHEFLKIDLGFATDEINWQKIKVVRERQYVHLLSQVEIESILADLHHQQATYSGEAAIQFANVRWAMLLGFYFGLRVRETTRLTLGDLYLNSQNAFLCVRRSKHGRSRRVYALGVTVAILRELREERKRRLEASRDLGAPFLVGLNNGAITPEKIRKEFSAALNRTRLHSDHNAQPIVFHTLRHLFANRLLLAGVPLITISNLMGHVSPETTVGSYLHCFDYLQGEQLRTHVNETRNVLWLSSETLGALIGLRRSAVYALVKRYERAIGKRIEKREAGNTRLALCGGRKDKCVLSECDASGLVAFHLDSNI